jgi:hypothetical protein
MAKSLGVDDVTVVHNPSSTSPETMTPAGADNDDFWYWDDDNDYYDGH